MASTSQQSSWWTWEEVLSPRGRRRIIHLVLACGLFVTGVFHFFGDSISNRVDSFTSTVSQYTTYTPGSHR